jgi:simple sugar transport system permease protein
MSDRTLDRIADGLSLAVTIFAALAVGVLIIWATSEDPAKALQAFFTGPFQNKFFFGNMLQTASPRIFTGLGLASAFQVGAVNLGAEGQVYVGALAGAALLLFPPAVTPLLVPVAVLLAALAGALFAGFAGWLRTRFAATEVITSFLIGAALIQLFDFFLRRYLVDPTAGFPTSKTLDAAFRLPRLLLPSNLNVSFIAGIVLAFITFFVLYRTNFGYRLRLTGSSVRYARYSGVRVGWYFIIAMAISGALVGMAGIGEVIGVHGRVITGLSPNLGWNGITVALVARLHPLGVIPAALLYGYLHSGANVAALLSDVSPRIAAIVQSLIFYLITAQALYVWFRRGLGARRRPSTAAPATPGPDDQAPSGATGGPA